MPRPTPPTPLLPGLAAAVVATAIFGGASPAAAAAPDSLAPVAPVVRPTGLTGLLPGTPAAVSFATETGPVTLELAPHSIRALDFTVWVEDDFGVVPTSIPAPRTYRGTVAGHPGSVAFGSIVDGALHGAFRLEPGSPWTTVEPVEPAAGAESGPAVIGPRPHRLITGSDPNAAPAICGVDAGFTATATAAAAAADPDDPARPAARAPGTFGSNAVPRPGDEARFPGWSFAGAVLVTDIMIDADFQYYQSNGSDVAATVLDIETVLNGVSMVYERDVDITWELTGVLVRTSSAANPYTTSSPTGLLCQVRDEWNAGALPTVRRDILHLFTGRDLSGGTVGIAFNTTICNVVAGSPCGGVSQNLGYGLVQSRWINNLDRRVALSCHELGHNYGASHCSGVNCHIMCATIGLCGGVDGADLEFSPGSQTAIETFRDTRNCLVPVADTLTPPLEEAWDTTMIDAARWPWFTDVAVVTPPMPAPSGPLALELRSFLDVPFRQGDLRSAEIDLSSGGPHEAAFSLGWASLEAGERVLVSYLDAAGFWTPMATITSDGTDRPFAEESIAIPVGGEHAGFRFRVQMPDGDEIDDRVWIDDIRVGPPADEPCIGDTDGSGAVDFTDLLAVLTDYGPCPGCDTDFDGDGNVDFADLLTVLTAYGPCP